MNENSTTKKGDLIAETMTQYHRTLSVRETAKVLDQALYHLKKATRRAAPAYQGDPQSQSILAIQTKLEALRQETDELLASLNETSPQIPSERDR